jgi:hypothetical protein
MSLRLRHHHLRGILPRKVFRAMRTLAYRQWYLA